MLTIDKFVTVSPEQYEIIIEGMRNPKNSWDRSDSECIYNDPYSLDPAYDFHLGPKDHALMESLASGGPVHAKYRRMIPVWVTITAPLYWWKEFDTYKVGTVCNSCSTMHKIADHEFTLNDFSCEYLIPETMVELLDDIKSLNSLRERYLHWDDKRDFCVVNDNQIIDRSVIWHNMIQLLPSSYNQKRTIMLNYEVLHNIYKWRKNHKLDEWHTFCEWIEKLPYAELIKKDEGKTISDAYEIIKKAFENGEDLNGELEEALGCIGKYLE